MNKRIGVIASDIELKNSITELFLDDVEEGNIIIDMLDPDNMESQGKILENKGAKIVVARSGGYKHISGTVNIPIVRLKITTIDVLQAIKRARKHMKEIVLVIWDEVYFNYDEWKDIINAEIILEKFKEKDEIKERVEKYRDKKDDVIIVGSGIACAFARAYGMDNVFINASKESIYETIKYAKELVDNLEDEKFKTEVLKTILDGVHDAVIAVDNEQRVILYNERAQELLGKDAEDVMHRELLKVLPSLDFMIDILENRVDKHGEIKYLESLTITTNTSILKVDGNTHGVLCSFQDITKLQKLEKKIRYELNKKGLYAKYKFEDLVANDPIMKGTIEKAKKVGASECTVIIYGESGTGKEMIAQGMHNISQRKDSPFVAINCAAISENLLESELFGYEEGAFTGARKGGKPGLFELAHGGTILLDEINSISLNLQAKLLRVLEEKEIMRIGSDYVIPLDVRVIAAANEELKRKVDDGSFRRDLFYRLSILQVNIPPLRKRKKDVMPLFTYYLKQLAGNDVDALIDKDIEEKLINYNWPGNVRELRNVAQGYLLLNEINLDEGEIIRHSNLEEKNLKGTLDLKEINRFIEDKIIDMLLRQGLTKTEIANMLGISRTALWKKINK
ncbi:sigma 54-interacting transcriptional regulator [Wukongibacter baidiensis]|uniref:sigma 54-interacting transcriptional regulator n=1 Tax=Wukongibacter baidiensis TaxID=1723361 RepID=UPI003D7F2712